MSDFRSPTKHKKKRRAFWHNYSLAGTYLLTIVIDGRSPLFGQLRYGPEVHIELTPLGRQIAMDEIKKIHSFYSNVQVWDYVIMPDHIHLIVHVESPFAENVHLGNVVYGFKTGCTRLWWEMSGQVPGGKTPGAVASFSDMRDMVCDKAATVPGVFPPGSRSKLPVLFEKGYNDGILMDDGQLERWKHYLRDNPRRLAIKRQHPDYFTVLHDLDICGRKCQITGNRFLLNNPDKMVVIVHRADSDDAYREHRLQWLACGERGGVLISAAIAPREKEVMREAMDRGYNIILLRENGFPDLYKPAGESFDACAEGQLLQISPWQHHTDHRSITRSQCLYLNDLAEKITKDTTWY